MSWTLPPTRRRALALLGAATLAPAAPGRAAARLPSLALFGPPAGPSVTLADAAATGALRAIADEVRFTAWRTPDELRAGLASGRIALSVAPVQAAANLRNRGFPLRLVNTMTDGLLYVIATDPAIDGVPALAGRTVAVGFSGDTPDIIFRALLAHHGLDPESDLTIRSAGTLIEAMQTMLSGRADAALVGEPAAAAAILRGAASGLAVTRAIDVQQAWGAMTGGAPTLPQAGLIATEAFLAAHPGVAPALSAALATAADRVRAEPAAAAARTAGALDLPAPVLAAAIPHARLHVRPARAARAAIERMLVAMAGPDLARIGGRLPDDDFYL